MTLLDLWNTGKSGVEEKHVKQIIGIAGNGKLANNNRTSDEFRNYLSYVPTQILIRYCGECLTEKFEQSGYALQDIVNQIGKRLSFSVIDGPYRGTQGTIGFDGIWKSIGNGDIVIEVKTSDV